MNIKPTFFSLTGFLAPGVVLIANASFLWIGKNPDLGQRILRGVGPEFLTGNGGLVLGIALAVFLVVAAFALGSILSEIFILVGRKICLRIFRTRTDSERTGRLFQARSLRELVQDDPDSREAMVYLRTCGLDLNWFAGRIRMIGGTSIALLLGALYSVQLGYSGALFFYQSLLALFAFVLAVYRCATFDQYVASIASVLILGGGATRQSQGPQGDDRDVD